MAPFDENRMLTVYMLSHVIGRAGGIEMAMVDLVGDLRRRGHAVTVYACRPPDGGNQYVDRLVASGADVRHCPAWLAAIAGVDAVWRLRVIRAVVALLSPALALAAGLDAVVRRRSIGRAWAGARGKARAAMAWIWHLERLYYLPLTVMTWRRRPDVVHVHGWGCGHDPPGGLAWARARGLPTAYTEHNSPPAADGGSRPRSWLNLADVIVACSHAGAAGLREVCCAEKPIVVIPYSVADPVPKIPAPHADVVAAARPVTFTCLARMGVDQKRQDVLLHAFRRVVDAGRDARLLLAGDGEDRAMLERMAREIGVAARVCFLGVVPRARLAWLMNESDVMVLPSAWEGLPVSIIESMAFGKPVVASDVGGNPELVADGVSGRVVPPGDPGALAEALLELAGDPGLRARMGAAARRGFQAGGFDPAAVGEATLGAYARAMRPQLA